VYSLGVCVYERQHRVEISKVHLQGVPCGIFTHEHEHIFRGLAAITCCLFSSVSCTRLACTLARLVGVCVCMSGSVEMGFPRSIPNVCLVGFLHTNVQCVIYCVVCQVLNNKCGIFAGMRKAGFRVSGGRDMSYMCLAYRL